MQYDLKGQRFGKLVVIEKDGKQGTSQMWKCRCDCGKTIELRTNSLLRLGRDSCGCGTKEKIRKARTTHGQTNSKLYSIWRSMKKRCLVPKTMGFRNYGGRGIRICKEWETDFIAFKEWAFANGYKDGLEIDRIDVNGDYEPCNCRFADDKQQANNKRNNRVLALNGEEKTLQEWAEQLGVSRGTLAERKRHGWSDYDTLTRKIRVYNKGVKKQ